MIIALLAGIGFAVGLTLVVASLTGSFAPNDARPTRTKARRALLTGKDRRNLLIGLAVGVVLAALGWLVAVLIVPVVALVVPWLMRADPGTSPDDLEALEEWTRSLSGVIGAGQGITSAIIATRTSCPERIRTQVERLIARIYARRPLDQALYAFADEIDNQVGDFLAAALIQASRHEGAALSKALDGIAMDVTDEVRARRDIEASRASARSQSRLITGIVVVALAGFILLTPMGSQYRSSPTGQVLLVVVVAAFLGALYWLKRAATTKPLARFLSNPRERSA